MDRNAFGRLCYLVEHVGGLVDSRYVTVPKKVSIFLSILAHHKKNMTVKFDFWRLGYTISVHFHAVLKLHRILLVKLKPIDDNCNNARWKPFKDCLGALDVSYIDVQVLKREKPRFRTRKGEEGSVVDSRVLRNAVHRPNGLRVPTVKGMIAHGWKADNGFRVGYLNHLADEMMKVFPVTDIWSSPHINSKMHAWKKHFGMVYALLGSSGIGWNETTKMLEGSNEHWEKAIKDDPSCKMLRHKPWPHYNHWLEIFGKDRANGGGAEDCGDAATAVNQEQTQTEHQASPDFEGVSGYTPTSDEHEATSIGALDKFIDNADARLGELTHLMAHEHKLSSKKEAMYETVSVVDDLSLQQKLVASNMINKNHVSLNFLSP
ncbi:hypothetical protein BUALT_Bualt03G0160000 [Buddleja alternifolia]|uniref:Myb/SANT-like domain-containing protein n=1 Tax=Buddleja alternifolia TaxID=168488 RepID=A0AAV6Y5H1_9LAMI|nr:hypothetical protein BUALT_Bualt03G0160000 [Buddleja alternifolia]